MEKGVLWSPGRLSVRYPSPLILCFFVASLLHVSASAQKSAAKVDLGNKERQSTADIIGAQLLIQEGQSYARNDKVDDAFNAFTKAYGKAPHKSDKEQILREIKGLAQSAKATEAQKKKIQAFLSANSK